MLQLIRSRAAFMFIMAVLALPAHGAEKRTDDFYSVTDRNVKKVSEAFELLNSIRSDELYCLAYDSMLSKEWSDALGFLDRAKKLDSKSIRIRRHVLQCLLKLNDYETFEREAKALEAIAPNSVAAKLFRGDFYMRRHQPTKALAEYTAAGAASNPASKDDQVRALRKAVEIFIQRNNAANAIKLSERIVNVDPSETTLLDRLRLARLLELAGRFDEAYDQNIILSRMDRIRNAPVLFADMLWRLAKISRARKRVDESNRFLVQMLDVGGAQGHKRFKAAVKLSFQAAKESYEKREYEKSYEILTRVTPHVKDARIYLAKSAIETARFEEASRLVDTLLKESPVSIETVFAAMRLKSVQGDQKAVGKYRSMAMEAIRSSIKHQPDPLNYYLLGTLLLQEKNYADSVATLKKSLSLEPPEGLKVRSMLALAQAYEQSGESAKATEQLQGILSKGSNSAAHYLMASFLSKDTNSLKLAKLHAREAVQNDPTNGQYVFLFVSICMKMWYKDKNGTELQQEMTWLEKVSESRSTPITWSHIGDTYAILGEKAKAWGYWSKALDQAINSHSVNKRLIQSLRRKIERGKRVEKPPSSN